MHTTKIVNSDNIVEASWADDVLYITFKKGPKTYRYPGAPFQAYLDLINAESAGKHFHAQIKNSYAGSPIETAEAIAAGVTS